MAPEPQPPAPAVVAVVVTCDPGPWFEQALGSLAGQDYPNLSILVVDAASEADPTERVAELAPGAFVSRLDRRVGFGRAANEVLKLVDGASHFLFCHDDVVLAPDAVRLLLEEAFRSNAGIASPKYTEWSNPDRLLAVGATADKVGVLQDVVDPGEPTRNSTTPSGKCWWRQVAPRWCGLTCSGPSGVSAPPSTSLAKTWTCPGEPGSPGPASSWCRAPGCVIYRPCVGACAAIRARRPAAGEPPA